jgi:hypothetical protein
LKGGTKTMTRQEISELNVSALTLKEAAALFKKYGAALTCHSGNVVGITFDGHVFEDACHIE